jgi:hypothetical protein
MGTIEFHIDNIVPGGKEVLLLGLSSVTLPTPRKVNQEQINYLNGVVNYPSRPQALGLLTTEFNDFIDGRQREILHKWFDKIYDERTGLGSLPSDIKTEAHLVLFGPDGVKRAAYYMKGVFPMGDPDLPNIAYDSGAVVKMSVDFSVDFMEPEFGEISNTTSFGTLG